MTVTRILAGAALAVAATLSVGAGVAAASPASPALASPSDGGDGGPPESPVASALDGIVRAFFGDSVNG